MNIPIFKRPAVERLWRLALHNADQYKGKNFEADGELIRDDEIQRVQDVEFDENLFGQFVYPSTDRTTGQSDAANALVLYQELRGMTPKIARDERVWCALSHLYATDFIWKRHVEGVSPEKVSRNVQTRYFCRANGGGRGFERDNALSRLWWWAFISSKVEKISHAVALEVFLEATDFRDAVMGRPTASIIPNVFEALLLLYLREKESDPDVLFFSRKNRSGKKGKNYRELLKLINRHGGRAFYDTMGVDELYTLFKKLRDSLN